MQQGTKKSESSTTLELCAVDGAKGCVANDNFPAASTTNLAAKVLSGQSVAGVNGTVNLPVLPLVGKVLSGTKYGAGGVGLTGTLTLPTASTVLLGSGTYGDPDALLTPSLAGTAPNCSADGQQSCVAVGSYKALNPSSVDASKMLTTQTLLGVVGTVNLTNLSAGNIKNSVAIGGVTGTYGPACGADGAGSCYVDGTTYKVLNPSSVDASKMLTTQTLLGVVGAVNLTNLSAGNIKNAVAIGGVTGTYGPACASNGAGSCLVDGTTYKALNPISIDAAKMLTTQTLLGVVGTVDLTNLLVGNIKNAVAIGGVTGTYGPACASNGAGSCYVDGTTYKALNPTAIEATKMLTTQTLLSVTGSISSCASDGSSSCYVPSFVTSMQPTRPSTMTTVLGFCWHSADRERRC